jgi:hypothetical protein
VSLAVASLARRRRGNEGVDPQSIWKQSWVELGERRFFARSRWEANYGRYLEWLRTRGEIANWKYEPAIYEFPLKRGVTSNKPDFGVTENTGRYVLHEVKGWMDPKSKTRIKRMKKYYPNVEMIIINGGIMASIAKLLGPVIPGWE